MKKKILITTILLISLTLFSVYAASTANVVLTNSTKINVTQIENIIKQSNINFDINNYEIENTEGFYIYDINSKEKQKVASYIDYKFKIGDFITNSGYTIVLNENNDVIEINDNSIQTDNVSVFSNTNDFTITENDYTYYLEKATTQLDQDIYTIISEDITFAYDVHTQKKYVYVDLEVISDANNYELKTFTFDF